MWIACSVLYPHLAVFGFCSILMSQWHVWCSFAGPAAAYVDHASARTATSLPPHSWVARRPHSRSSPKAGRHNLSPQQHRTLSWRDPRSHDVGGRLRSNEFSCRESTWRWRTPFSIGANPPPPHAAHKRHPAITLSAASCAPSLSLTAHTHPTTPLVCSHAARQALSSEPRHAAR